MTTKLFAFEGDMLPLKEIYARCSAFSKDTVRKRVVDQGMTTRREVCSVDHAAQQRRGGRMGAKVIREKGFDRFGGLKTPCGVRV